MLRRFLAALKKLTLILMKPLFLISNVIALSVVNKNASTAKLSGLRVMVDFL